MVLGSTPLDVRLLHLLLQALLLGCSALRSPNETSIASRAVAISQVQPSSVVQYVPTRMTIQLNSSALCRGLAQGQPWPRARLFLRGAAPGGGGDAAISSSQPLDGCNRFEFPLVLNSSVPAGSFPAHVSTQHGTTLPLPEVITVVQPPLLAMAAHRLNISAGAAPFTVGVRLSPAPPQARPVRVSITTSSPECVRPLQDQVVWQPGEGGERSFQLALACAPAAAQLSVELALPDGAVVDPLAARTQLLLQSPLVSVQGTQGFYRAISLDSGGQPDSSPQPPPWVALRVDGSSDFPSLLRFETFLYQQEEDGEVAEGPRPPRPGAGCAAGAGARCSNADVRGNLTISGELRLAPGQGALAPLQLPLAWDRVPSEAEYRVGVRLAPLSNVRVWSPKGQVAVIVFGTPQGQCPPGAARRDVARRSGHSGPQYSDTAPLQELALQLCCGSDGAGGSANVSAHSSSNSSSGSGGGSSGSSEGSSGSSSGSLVALGQGSQASGVSGGNSSSGGRGRLADVDPPFRPLLDNYTVLLPAGADNSSLVLSSSRHGDVVVADASGCSGLETANWTVAWPEEGREPQQQAQMWRVQYSLAGLAGPCWLRVHVFTPEDGTKAPEQTQGGQQESRQQGQGTPGDQEEAVAVAPAARSHKLYYSYMLRLRPLSPPSVLALRAVWFTNASTTLVVCGNPSGLRHLLPPASSAQPAAGGDNSSRSQAANGAGAPGPNGSRVYEAAAGAGVDAQPGAQPWKGGTPGASGGWQQQGEVQVGALPAGAAAAPAGGLAAAARPQYWVQRRGGAWDGTRQVLDPGSGKLVVWGPYSPAVCSPERYLLAPLGLLAPDMRVVPELAEPSRRRPVDVSMSGGVLLLCSGSAAGLGGGAASCTGGGGGSGGLQAALPAEAAAAGSSAAEGPPTQVLANKDSGPGANSSDDGNDGSSNSSSSVTGSGGGDDRSSGSGGWGSGVRMLLGGSAELPIIVTTDGGFSSKTYTLVLYSNNTAAAALREAAVELEGGSGGRGGGGRRPGGGTGSGGSEGTDGRQQVFGARPPEWPPSPAQGSNCSVCPIGMYSSRIDAPDCQVCPPGKYAGHPLSTGCQLCPPGTFSHLWAAPACRACLPGTFSAASGSTFCDICPKGWTTGGEGTSECVVAVGDLAAAAAAAGGVVSPMGLAFLLSFGVVLDGASLSSVSAETTGINGSSEGIVAVLVAGDAASALNVSLGLVQVLRVQQVAARQLLVNVSATVPVDEEALAAEQNQELSADSLVQRLVDDPNTFLRTTQTLGAESAAVTDLTAQRLRLSANDPRLHAVLWPSLLGSLLLLAASGYGAWSWRQQRYAGSGCGGRAAGGSVWVLRRPGGGGLRGWRPWHRGGGGSEQQGAWSDQQGLAVAESAQGWGEAAAGLWQAPMRLRAAKHVGAGGSAAGGPGASARAAASVAPGQAV